MFCGALIITASRSDITAEHPLHHTLQVDPMTGSIDLIVFLVLLVAGWALVRHRQKRNRNSWRLLRDLSPVSGQWLADLRRSG